MIFSDDDFMIKKEAIQEMLNGNIIEKPNGSQFHYGKNTGLFYGKTKERTFWVCINLNNLVIDKYKIKEKI